MVAGKFFEVFVAEVVARADDQGRSQLEGASPGVVLSGPFGHGPRPCHKLAWAYQRELFEGAGAHQLRC